MDDCLVQTVSSGALVVVTVFSALRLVLLLLPHFVSSVRFDSAVGANRWSYVNRRLAVLHCVVLAPLFEIFVIWGPYVLSPDDVRPISADVLLTWLAVVVSSDIFLLVAFAVRRNYRSAALITHIMEMTVVTTFVAERTVYAHFAGEVVLLVALLITNVAEVFGVPDFFSHIFVRRRTDVESSSSSAAANDNPGDRRRPLAQRGGDSDAARFDKSEVSDELQSEDLAAKAHARNVAALCKLIVDANPAVMKIGEMRIFIDNCKKKVSLLMAQTPPSTPSPRRSPRHGSTMESAVSPPSSTRASWAVASEYGVLPSGVQAPAGGERVPVYTPATLGGGGGGSTIIPNSGLAARYNRGRAGAVVDMPEC